MEERQVQESALLPVHLGVGKNEMQNGHEQDVGAEEDETWVVHAGTKRIGEENQNEESAENLEEHGEEQNGSVEERCKVLVERAPLESGVVRCEAPG